MTTGFPYQFSIPNEESGLSRLDPRVRLLSLLILVIATSIVLTPVALGVITVTLVLAIIVLRIKPAALLKILPFFLVMAIITLILHLIFNKSKSEVSTVILGLPIREIALRKGVLYCWRILLFLIAAVVFVRMLSADELATALRKLMSPLRKVGVPVSGLSMATMLAVRFIPTILQQHRQIEFAQRARGATFSGGPLMRVRKTVPLLVPTVVSALRKSDTLGDALVIRCWGIAERRTDINERKLGAADLVFLAAALVWGVIVIGIGH